jgi:hypothetical protein
MVTGNDIGWGIIFLAILFALSFTAVMIIDITILSPCGKTSTLITSGEYTLENTKERVK